MNLDKKTLINGSSKSSVVRQGTDRTLHICCAFLIGLPAILILLKFLPWFGALKLVEQLSLTRLPAAILNRVDKLLLLSLGAAIVVLFRLSLGIRVLGPIRPMLIALAYQLTGYWVATVFLVTVMILIALIRPLLRSAGMPYFARIAIVLSLVSLMVLMTLEISLALSMDEYLRVALLPIIVLTFAAEGFAKTLYREGIKSASWRALMTILAAVLIKELTNIPGLHAFVLRFPELLIIQIGLVVLIGRYAKFNVFGFLNPKPISTKKSKHNRKKKQAVASAASLVSVSTN